MLRHYADHLGNPAPIDLLDDRAAEVFANFLRRHLCVEIIAFISRRKQEPRWTRYCATVDVTSSTRSSASLPRVRVQRRPRPAKLSRNWRIDEHGSQRATGRGMPRPAAGCSMLTHRA